MRRSDGPAIVAALLMALLGHQGVVEAQSFSIDSASPSATVGSTKPDDVLIAAFPALPPVLPPPILAIPGTVTPIEVDGFSYGRALNEFGTAPNVHFSVDRAGRGVASSAVSNEFNAALSEQSSDVFSSTLNSTNSLAYDGDGNGSGANPNVPALAVAEPVSYPLPPIPPPTLLGDVDALDLRNANILTLTSPTGVIYFTADSLTATNYGAFTGADVFVGFGAAGYDAPSAGVGSPPLSPSGVQPYASEISLGFTLFGNDIDALVVFDNGDQTFQPGQDVVAFSLAPGSPYLGTLDPLGSGLAINEGDILVDSSTAINLGAGLPAPGILFSAESLGLLTTRGGALQNDNLNALDFAVPEPTSAVLLLTAAIAWGLVQRRRR